MFDNNIIVRFATLEKSLILCPSFEHVLVPLETFIIVILCNKVALPVFIAESAEIR